MVRTRVGYAGGTKENPTYKSLGDHTEVVQVDYDPTQITYEELLAVFWSSHDATARPWSRQYAAFVFYHDDLQERLAQEAWEREAAKHEGKIYTEVIPYSEFYLAEAYHQKYRLQQEAELAAEFRALYPDDDDFVNSTAAARVNGYLAGYGSMEALRAEVDDLGLSPAAQEKLLELVRLWNR